MDEIRQASDTDCLDSSDVGLPPVKIQHNRIQSQVTDTEWGKAIIFDLSPVAEIQEPVVVEEKLRTRRSIYAPRSSMIIKKQSDEDVVKSDVDEDDDLNFYKLPYFYAYMITTIIEDTLNGLIILGECNNVIRIEKALTDMPILLKIKYGVKQKENVDFLDSINQSKLECLEYKIKKLQSDRESVVELFRNLYVELSTTERFLELIDFNIKVQEDEDHAIHIAEEEAKNKIVRKELIKQLRIQRNHHKAVAYETENLIASLKSQIEDGELLTETQGRYVDNWQAARTEQHAQVISEAEGFYTDSTFYYKRRSDHETRVHAEVESLTNTIITETLEDIEKWMEKYDTDMEKIDLRIQIQNSEYLKMRDKRIELDNLYKVREKAMKDWKEFTAEREKQREYERRMNLSAIIVQAWWRGLLVRKQLGPYRQKKGKKGKAKK